MEVTNFMLKEMGLESWIPVKVNKTNNLQLLVDKMSSLEEVKIALDSIKEVIIERQGEILAKMSLIS